jgi:hypothetical protein
MVAIDALRDLRRSFTISPPAFWSMTRDAFEMARGETLSCMAGLNSN